MSLWNFTERNSWQTGDLEKWGVLGIAKAGRWQGSPENFIAALQKTGFLDNFKIHQWQEHQSGMIHDRTRRIAGTLGGDLAGKIPAPGGDSAEPDKIREEKIREEKRREETDKRAFTRPTLAQISEYIKAEGKPVDAKKFFNHYESNGWKVGQSSMKSWKAAINTWSASKYNDPPAPIVNMQKCELWFDSMCHGKSGICCKKDAKFLNGQCYIGEYARKT